MKVFFLLITVPIEKMKGLDGTFEAAADSLALSNLQTIIDYVNCFTNVGQDFFLYITFYIFRK